MTHHITHTAYQIERAADLISEANAILDHIARTATPATLAQIEAIPGVDLIGPPLAKPLQAIADGLNLAWEEQVKEHDKSCREIDAEIAAASTRDIEAALAQRVYAGGL